MKRALIGMVLLVLVGCSSSSSTTASGGTSSAPSEGGSVPANCTDLTSSSKPSVTISGFVFDPSCLIIKSGSSLTLTNKDSADHTLTISGTSVDISVPAGKSANGNLTGLAPGTYQFSCTIHPSMTGTLVVQ